MEFNRITKGVSVTKTVTNTDQVVSVLLSALIIQVLELMLLERKYDLFSGGFLQPYSYLSWTDRGAFIFVSFWTDIALLSGLGFLWYRVSERLENNSVVTAYNFTFFSVSLMGIWLAIKFKVLSYFNDALDLFVIKNLAGGSLMEAVGYVLNEATIIFAGLVGLIGIYFAGLYFFKKYVKRNRSNLKVTIGSKKRFRWVFLASLITVFLVSYTNSNAAMRYGLGKKTSYYLIRSLIDEASDYDRDGFGLVSFPKDPDNTDSNIYPGALDVPGNGVDEDGIGGDFVWDGIDIDPLDSLSPTQGKHVVLIVLESARGDMIDKEWNGKAVAKNISEMAKHGSKAEFAYSHTGYTVPSIKALLNQTLSSKKDRTSLIDYLSDAGYNLSFISGQDESFGGIAESTGMDKPGSYLFDARSAIDDRVYSSKAPSSLRLSEERVVRQFKIRSGDVNWNQPQFFYINLQAAHFPYSHPKMPKILVNKLIKRSDINKDNIEMLQGTYWNAIAVADQAVGEILQQLKDLNAYEGTLVVVVGDHGESLFDDDFLGHGHALNEHQTHIPLVFSVPGIELKTAFGQIDVAELIVRIASNRSFEVTPEMTRKPQLQIVGSIHRPKLIGTVVYGGIRTIFDFRTRKLFYSDHQRWVDYEKAITTPELEKRATELIEMWELVRWRDHLSRRSGQNNTKKTN